MVETWVALEAYAKQYHREVLAHAETARLLRLAAPPSDLAARVTGRLRSWLGRLLVSLGTRLQGADDVSGPGLRRAS